MDKSVKNVRNFWVEVEIDGQKTKLVGGPKGKEGGLKITLYQRDNGMVTQPVELGCVTFVDPDTGEITLGSYVWDAMEQTHKFAHYTKR